MHHVTMLKSSQTGFFNMAMSSLDSNVIQSLDLNLIGNLRDVVERDMQVSECECIIPVINRLMKMTFFAFQ